MNPLKCSSPSLPTLLNEVRHCFALLDYHPSSYYVLFSHLVFYTLLQRIVSTLLHARLNLFTCTNSSYSLPLLHVITMHNLSNCLLTACYFYPLICSLGVSDLELSSFVEKASMQMTERTFRLIPNKGKSNSPGQASKSLKSKSGQVTSLFMRELWYYQECIYYFKRVT